MLSGRHGDNMQDMGTVLTRHGDGSTVLLSSVDPLNDNFADSALFKMFTIAWNHYESIKTTEPSVMK